MGGAALAQIYFNCLQIPVAPEAAGNEIHRIALQATLQCQGIAHRLAIPHQLQAIASIRWKATALVGLATGASEDLLVGGEHFNLATGIDRALHTGGTKCLSTLQPSLNKGSLLNKQLAPRAGRHGQQFKARANQPTPFGRAIS